MRTAIVVALVSLLAVSACGGSEQAGDPSTESGASESVALPSGPDPCALVSRSEMESLIGPLAEPPYRAGERRAKVDGDACFYRAADGRSVTLEADFEDGELTFAMLGGASTAATDAIMGYDASADTLEGTWDKVAVAFGRLIALTGKTSIIVDPIGSRFDLGAAAKIAAIAVSRAGAPLDYSGARATAARRETAAAERNPCTLVTRPEAEALMGPLKGDPSPSSDGSECAYLTSVEMFGAPVTRTLKVVWTDGFYALGHERLGMSGAKKAMEQHIDPDIPDLGTNTVGEAEPWDERVTLLGGLVTVVKQDVLLQINGEGVGGFDESKAMALLRLACRRL